MWIFLPDGFLSIVADHSDPVHGPLLVRARVAGHIEAVFPEAEVRVTPAGDYLYRATVHRHRVAEVIAARALRMEHTNFKAAVDDLAYHDACLEVWLAMNALQRKMAQRARDEKRQRARRFVAPVADPGHDQT